MCHRSHTHPCSHEGCRAQVPCEGTWERNYDGWPAAICTGYHLSNGEIADVRCEDHVPARFTLDTCDWPLIINSEGDDDVAHFPLPDGSTGDDARGLAQLARAKAFLALLNSQEESHR